MKKKPGATTRINVRTNNQGFVGTANIVNFRANRAAKMDHAACVRALKGYLKAAAGEWSVLPLIGLDEKASDAQRSGQLTLDSVYTSLNCRSSVRSERERSEITEPSRLQTLAEMAWKHPRSVVLGDPGAGKSTFCHHLCWSHARQLLNPKLTPRPLGQLAGWSECRRGLIPTVLLLRVFARQLAGKPSEPSAKLLWDFLVAQAQGRYAPTPEEYLAAAAGEGWLLVCFDGADEVPPDQQEFVRECLEKFVISYPEIRILLTCRIIPWQRLKWKLPGFECHLAAEFDDDQIRQFIAAWYETHHKSKKFSPAEAEERANSLRAAALDRPELRRLAGNPMLLTMMASLHTHTGKLPDDRARLYQAVVEHLLRRWDDTRKIGDETFPGIHELFPEAGGRADDNSLLRALAQAAYEAHAECPPEKRHLEDPPPADIPMDRLRLIFRKLHCKQSGDWAEQLVRTLQVRSGLLIPREEEVFCFPHRSFQEFFAALHLVKLPHWEEKAVQLVEATGYWREVILWAAGRATHLNDTPEQTILLARTLSPAAEPSTAMDWRRTMLAAEIVLESQPAKLAAFTDGEETTRRIRDRLVTLLKQSPNELPPSERALAGMSLGRLGDPREGVGVHPRQAGVPWMKWSAEIPAGEFQLGGGSRRRIEVPYRLAVYVVTVAQYELFVKANGYGSAGEARPEWWTESGWKWRCQYRIEGPAAWSPAFQTANHPRVGVTWYEAVAYCRWLNRFGAEKLGLSAGWAVRLPTKAEWEKAASAGGTRKYPWVGTPDWAQHGNIRETGIGHTSAVGLFPAGAAECGCHDLAGNVWEYCHSMWPKGQNENATVFDVLETDELRCVRGGAWDYDSDDALWSYSNWFGPRHRNGDLGFRVAASPISEL